MKEKIEMKKHVGANCVRPQRGITLIALIITICEKLYSNEYGKARSMNMDDVDECVGVTIKQGGYDDGSGVSHLADEENLEMTVAEVKAKGITVNGTSIPDLDEYESIDDVKMNAYAYKLNSTQDKLLQIYASTDTPLAEQNMTENAKNVIYGTNKQSNNWLATRGSSVYFGGAVYVYFGLGTVKSGCAIAANNNLFWSVDFSISDSLGLRPVVSLTFVIPDKAGT